MWENFFDALGTMMAWAMRALVTFTVLIWIWAILSGVLYLIGVVL